MSQSSDRLTRRALVGAALAGAGALALPAALRTSSQSTPEARRGGRPAVALAFDDRHREWMRGLVYDSLLRVDPDGEVVSALAASHHVSADELVHTLGLRHDAVFSDGTLFTSDAVVASLEAALDTPAAWRLEHVEQIEARDANTVEITLRQPDVSLPASLAAPALAIVHPDDIGLDEPLSARGCGPFRVTEASSERIELERNRGYWQVGRPRFDGATLIHVPEDPERITQLLLGEFDILPDVPLVDVPTIGQDPEHELVGGASRRLCYLVANAQSGHLTDREMRRLIAGVVDRELLIEAAAVNEARPLGTLIPDDHWAALDVAPPALASAEAREELVRRGHPAGVTLSLITDAADVTLANAAVMLQEQYAAAGVELSISLLERTDLDEAVRDGAFDLVLRYGPLWTDPHELMRTIVASDGEGNVGGYANDEVDELILAGIATSDEESRAEIYEHLQEIVLTGAPLIPLFASHYYDGISTRVQAYPTYPAASSQPMRYGWLSPQSEIEPE